MDEPISNAAMLAAAAWLSGHYHAWTGQDREIARRHFYSKISALCDNLGGRPGAWFRVIAHDRQATVVLRIGVVTGIIGPARGVADYLWLEGSPPTELRGNAAAWAYRRFVTGATS